MKSACSESSLCYQYRTCPPCSLLDDYARSPLARAPALCRPWACVPRSLQVVSGGGRRAFFGRGQVRGTQCASGQLGVARKSGDGLVFGGEVVAVRTKRRSCRSGPWTSRRIGLSASTAPITTRSWRHCVAACSAGGPTARRNGSGRSPSVLAWNQPIVRTVGRGSLARATKSLTPYEKRVFRIFAMLPIPDLSPLLPQAAGADGQRCAGPPSDLQPLGGPLETLQKGLGPAFREAASH